MFLSRDVTFFELVPFFSSGKTSLQGVSLGEKLSSSKIALPILVHFTLIVVVLVEMGKLNSKYILKERRKVIQISNSKELKNINKKGIQISKVTRILM